ncbi:MAG: type II toxin-antitoxin system VapC family toxin [Thiotrichales bacterium]|nr:type II toxin-antitoxin system VapC family toxin [Thiotrichales bacterium]
MKSFVIDTHIFLWLTFDPSKVDASKLAILKNPKNKVYVPNVSFWEIALKYQLGKLDLQGVLPTQLPDLAEKMGLDVLDITAETMASFFNLPKVDNHKDPFDRMIIWHCICNKATLISQDKKFPEYQKYGLVVA